MALDYYSKPSPDRRVLEGYTVSGMKYRLAYCRHGEFHLSIPQDTEHSRFGSWPEICEDITFLDTYGVLPRNNSGCPW